MYSNAVRPLFRSASSFLKTRPYFIRGYSSQPQRHDTHQDHPEHIKDEHNHSLEHAHDHHHIEITPEEAEARARNGYLFGSKEKFFNI